MTRLCVAVMLLAFGVATVFPVAAQESTPETTAASQLVRFLPAAEDLGEGWEVSSAYTPSADPSIFADSTGAVYVGPRGARVVLEVYQNLPGRAAVQRSWEAIGWSYFGFMLNIDYAFGREDDLAGLPLPSGTVDARRLDGRDEIFDLPIAVAMYAVDPDITLLVVVSGSIDAMAGYEAADHVASLAIGGGQG